MPLFRITDSKLQQLRLTHPATERDIQRLIEGNLLEVLDVYFLETEYRTTSGGRMDTLGVDRNGAPTIIEYKKTQNDNVINQGLSYLRWLTTQKVEFFEMLISRRLSKEIADALAVDWRNPRLICIAKSFNRFDIDTIEMIGIKVELISYQVYEGGIFSLEPLQVTGQRALARSAGELRPDSPTTDENANQVDVLRTRGSEEIRSIFDDIRARVLALGPQVVERPTRAYVAYRATKTFLEVHIQRSQLRLLLRPIDYEDPKIQISKMPDSYNWTLDRELRLVNQQDIAYVMGLIEQSYNDVI